MHKTLEFMAWRNSLTAHLCNMINSLKAVPKDFGDRLCMYTEDMFCSQHCRKKSVLLVCYWSIAPQAAIACRLTRRFLLEVLSCVAQVLLRRRNPRPSGRML